MKQWMLSQLQFIGILFLFGLATMLCYTITFRLFRKFIRHKKWMYYLEDLLYWSVVSVPGYLLFLFLQDGEIRWYGMLSLFAGMIFFEGVIYRQICHFWHYFDKKYCKKQRKGV